jgi:GDP-4-dehydro-6-deoxy-D-mannose reductase
LLIAVTGASGFVGPHLVAHLRNRGHRVEAIGRSSDPPDLRDSFGSVIGARFELQDYSSVSACLSELGADAIVHLAGQASVRRSWEAPGETLSSNVVGAAHLLEAARQAGTRVLLVGSAQQYARSTAPLPLKESDPLAPSSPYAVGKTAQEQIGLAYHGRYGLPVLATRSFNHTGPGQSREYAVGSFCAQIAEVERGERVRLEVGNLDARRDMLDVRDVVAAYAALVESGRVGEVYNVCSGRAIRVGDMLSQLLGAAGMDSSVEVVAAPSTSQDTDILVGDPSKIRADVGWEPQIPLERSLAETLDWYRSSAVTAEILRQT